MCAWLGKTIACDDVGRARARCLTDFGGPKMGPQWGWGRGSLIPQHGPLMLIPTATDHLEVCITAGGGGGGGGWFAGEKEGGLFSEKKKILRGHFVAHL